MKEMQKRKSRQESKMRSRRSEGYRLVSYGLIILLSYAIHHKLPKGATTPSEVGVPTLTKKMSNRLTYRAVLGRLFFQLRFFPYTCRFMSS